MADERRASRVREEMADVLGSCLLRLADVLQVNLTEAIDAKIAAIALKYPIEASRGERAEVRRTRRARDAGQPSDLVVVESTDQGDGHARAAAGQVREPVAALGFSAGS